METQNARLLKYLESGKKVTQYEAMQELGIFRLSARIYDLSQIHDIRREWVEVVNRFGEPCRIRRYFMETVASSASAGGKIAPKFDISAQ